MNLLAFDTSTTACSIAIQKGDEVRLSHQIAPMQQARLILPVIQDLLNSVALTVNDLDAIVYGCGPGSFTGIRIASSVAQGIAFALNKPVVQISSLAAIAQSGLRDQHLNRMLVAVDARMDEIYWAAYEANKQGYVELQGQEQVSKPEDVTLPAGDDWYGVGDGWLKYQDDLASRLGFRPHAIYPAVLPTAEDLLQLARIKLAQGEWVAAADAVPVYLR